MGRRGNKRIDNFEEDCNLVRLQLMYLDDVNDTGQELLKMQRESELHDGQMQMRRMQEITEFAGDNGFFFFYAEAGQEQVWGGQIVAAQDKTRIRCFHPYMSQLSGSRHPATTEI